MNDKSCLICQRIKLIKEGRNPYFVKELETGYVVLGDYQTYEGYTLFLCKEHVEHLHDLPERFREKFLQEISKVGEAVFAAFSPEKLNYELLGNTDIHLHWHIFPRRSTDEKADKAVWEVEKSRRSKVLSAEELGDLKANLLKQLD
ncbi:MAG: HIT family protein [Candidatus Pacebacteria bacterium CG10_big_fil_rev_8_21_14_0_10_42_12]|nr:MAG: HIT family protein [Candidatus Pacebacteria bacterium CG10_big_fil_rev_8_21_14_0_10_42_12]